jgi:hypothetical protein
MPRDHSLRPDGDTEDFDWVIRMEKHPDGEPCRTITMDGADDDPGNANCGFL